MRNQDISSGEGAAHPRKILAQLDSSKLGCTLLGAGCSVGLGLLVKCPSLFREVYEATFGDCTPLTNDLYRDHSLTPAPRVTTASDNH